MKLLLSLIAVLALAFGVQAQQNMVLTSLAANTSSNVLAFSAIIDNIAVVNSTTNAAQINFYDSSNTTTTVVRAAYTSYASYATNFSVVFTNEAGILVTNTFVGTYTGSTANSAVTNSRPILLSVVIPANSTLSKDVNFSTLLGLTAVPNQDLTLVTTYRAQ